MCLTCGCGEEENVRVNLPAGAVAVQGEHPHDHPDGHDHPHGHDRARPLARDEHVRLHAPAGTEKLELGAAILAKNDHLAGHNRGWLAKRDICAVNLMSSPGSGKTTLLERTISELKGGFEVCVIEGDQETLFDSERIQRAGARAVQVNTGAGCHLDAPMVQQALETLNPAAGSLLFIENVGNLVCPALFDVGEQAKVVIISVTEGDDKALKYPHMFACAHLVVINKTDLLPYVDFDVDKFTAQARSLNPGVKIVSLSARTGENIVDWYDWLGTLHQPVMA